MEVGEGKAPEPLAKPTIEAPLQSSSKLIFRIWCILVSYIIIVLSKDIGTYWKTIVKHLFAKAPWSSTPLCSMFGWELFLPSAM